MQMIYLTVILSFCSIVEGLVLGTALKPVAVDSIEECSWVVRVQLFKSFTCSGSIVSPSWALTAQLCVINHNMSDIKVLSGAARWNDNSTEHEVLRVVLHSLRHSDQIYGLSVAGLKVGVPNFEKQRKLSLPKTPFKFNNCVLYGWGKRYFYENKTEVSLRKTYMSVAKDIFCSCFVKSHTKIVLCSPCSNGNLCDFGDLGAPLLCQGHFMGIAIEYYDGQCKLDYFTRTSTVCGESGRGVFSYLCPQLPWIYSFLDDIQTQNMTTECKGIQHKACSSLLFFLSTIACTNRKFII